MQIVKVEDCVINGTITKRIYWQDGDNSGVAVMHCAITGKPISRNYYTCIQHCRQYGHCAREVDEQIEANVIRKLPPDDSGSFAFQLELFGK